MTTNNSSAAVPVAGGTMTGNLILNGDPTIALQACTKQYADNIAAGGEYKAAVNAGSTTALTVTYSNGTAGVGATLTNAGAMAAFAVDGQTLAVGKRVLIKDQSSAFQNGIYVVTVAGSGAVNWVLTRSLDYNTPAQIQPGDLVPIIAGTVNANTVYLETATVTTIGTDSITFQLFQSAPLALPVVVANGGTGVSTLTTAYGTLCAGTTATGTVQTVSPGTSGLPLVSGGSSALPSYAGLTVAGGGTGVTTLTTAYAPVCAGTTATGAVQVASTGLSTSGYVLTSNGASALPSFQAAAGGATPDFTFVSTSSATPGASTFDVTGLTANNYLLIVQNFRPTGSGNDLQMQVGTGGGPTIITTNYVYGGIALTHGGLVSGTNTSGASYMLLDTNSDGLFGTLPGNNAFIYVNNVGAAQIALFNWEINGAYSTSIPLITLGTGWNTTTTALTAIRFIAGGGTTIAQLKVSIYTQNT